MNTRRLLLSPVRLLVALLTVIGTNTSSAATGSAAETRVRAIGHVTVDSVGQPSGERPASVGCVRPETVAMAVGSCVATNTGPSIVETETMAARPLKATEATNRWEEFLGEGPYTNSHPRTGVSDPNRIVSADGARSIRMGPHEMNSSPTKFHFHEETWSFDSSTNTWNIANVIQRVPLK